MKDKLFNKTALHFLYAAIGLISVSLAGLLLIASQIDADQTLSGEISYCDSTEEVC